MSAVWRRDERNSLLHRFPDDASAMPSCGIELARECIGPPEEMPARRLLLRMAPSAGACSRCMEAEVYPEHAKLRALGGKNEIVGNFIEWLRREGYTICRWRDNLTEQVLVDGPPLLGVPTVRQRTIAAPAQYLPERGHVEDWIGRFFGIDPRALEAEKQLMLDAIREAHDG